MCRIGDASSMSRGMRESRCQLWRRSPPVQGREKWKASSQKLTPIVAILVYFVECAPCVCVGVHASHEWSVTTVLAAGDMPIASTKERKRTCTVGVVVGLELWLFTCKCMCCSLLKRCSQGRGFITARFFLLWMLQQQPYCMSRAHAPVDENHGHNNQKRRPKITAGKPGLWLPVMGENVNSPPLHN